MHYYSMFSPANLSRLTYHSSAITHSEKLKSITNLNIYMCLCSVSPEIVKVVEETPVEEVLEEVVADIQEEVPSELEPATIEPQFIQIFDDVVSVILHGAFLLMSNVVTHNVLDSFYGTWLRLTSCLFMIFN